VGHCHDCSAKFSHFLDLLELSRVFLELRKERRRVGLMVSIIVMYTRAQSDQAQRKRVGCGDDEGAKLRMKGDKSRL